MDENIEQAKAIFAKFGIQVSDVEAIPLAKKVMAGVNATEIQTGRAVTPNYVKVIVNRLRDIRPVLHVSDMMFVSNIEQIERILSNNRTEPIYQHNGRLVRVEGTQITHVLPEWLTSYIGRFIKFEKYDNLSGINQEIYPPHACILTILRQKDSWPFKRLPDALIPKAAPPEPKASLRVQVKGVGHVAAPPSLKSIQVTRNYCTLGL
jgi:hypothetical protein